MKSRFFPMNCWGNTGGSPGTRISNRFAGALERKADTVAAEDVDPRHFLQGWCGGTAGGLRTAKVRYGKTPRRKAVVSLPW
jgi:hypothetical protein